MAEYLVRSESLASVADAIRAKGGTTEALEFPGGFVSAVNGITAGGGGDDSYWFSILDRSITELNNSQITTLGASAFRDSGIVSVNLPNLTSVTGNYCFGSCKMLKTAVLPSITAMGSNLFDGSTLLEKVDFGMPIRLVSTAFRSCAALKTLILRSTTLCVLQHVNVFTSTPFASGGTGGTVYVPSALIESYQNETNWSTLYAAGTCNFVAIEGSEYE